MESLEATRPLFDSIKNYKKLAVDDYQRPYSWGREQLEEFFADLCETADSDEPHFFGTLIVQSDPNSSDRVTIVDGQQRLTTCFIMVAALRDAIEKLGIQTIQAQKDNMRDTNVMEVALDFLNPTNQLDDYRFQSSRYMRKILFDCVFASSSKQKDVPQRDRENKQLTLAFRNAVRTLRELLRVELENYGEKEEVLNRIHQLLVALTERFTVLKLTTKDTVQSLEIFLTLNNRGLPLGPSDLVRGQVMSNLGANKDEAEQRAIQQKTFDEWTAIHENVEDPEAFLRHYLVATSDSKVQKKKIVRFVEKRIGGNDVLEKRANTEAFWEDLLKSSNLYRQIIEPQMGGDCQYHLELLEGLTKSHRIVLLEVLRREFDEKVRDEIIRLIFVLTYRWVISGMNAQKLEDLFQAQCVRLRSDVDPELITTSLKERIDELQFDTERLFSLDADSSFAYRAVLHYVNKKTAHGSTAISLTSKSLHLEHIAPQTKTPEWLVSFFGNDREKFEDYESIITSIGNLTLLDPAINIGSGNEPFSVKRDNYKKSVMDITRDLAQFTDWDFGMVELRTKWLAEMFDRIWASKVSATPIDRFSDWYQTNS